MRRPTLRQRLGLADRAWAQYAQTGAYLDSLKAEVVRAEARYFRAFQRALSKTRAYDKAVK